jgi:uncharacterized iron-regulated membrane protein
MVYNSPDLQMGTWKQWLRQPQRVWLRRASFQIHLWGGLILGLYVVVLSLTGSALVYRNELDRYLATPHAAFDEQAKAMNADELRAVAQRAYPGWQVSGVIEGRTVRRPPRAGGPGGPGGAGAGRGGGRGRGNRPPDPTATITVQRDGTTKERLFNPYTGGDLGDSTTRGQFFLLWTVRLHDELLLDRPDGPWWNGLLSALFTVLVMTGLVVWWPGVTRWKRSLGIKWSGGWRRLNWDLHSAIGFWLFLFMLMWGVSGWYLGMPEPLTNLVERYSDPEGVYGERPGDVALMWLSRLHFGRWREPGWGPWLKATWAIVGVVPAVLFVTGTIMWWNRKIRHRAARNAPEAAEAA